MSRVAAIVVSAAAALAVLLQSAAIAAVAPESRPLEQCRAIPDPLARVQCYDRAVDEAASAAPPAALPPAAPIAATTTDADSTVATHSWLARRWELDTDEEHETWRAGAHRRNYLLPAHLTSDRNEAPYSPALGPAPAQPYDDLELKLQLSFKSKALDDLFGTDADVWIAYSQRSHWQVFNEDLSRPFRATDYEPEVFVSLPFRFEMLGVTARILNLGFVHESNGQSEPRSRSWNRLYAQIGLERGPFTVYLRPWSRFKGAGFTDDNPDITDYVGRGDIEGIWTHREHEVSLLLRNSFSGDWHGAAQLDWSFPLYGRLKGYVQLFSGYGESLIDYNHAQTTLGVGVLLADPR